MRFISTDITPKKIVGVKTRRKVVTFIVVALFIVTGAAAIVGATGLIKGQNAASSVSVSGPNQISSSITPLPNSGYTNRGSSLLNTLETKGIPSNEIFLPNFHPDIAMSDGHVQPLYSVAPAPMGIGDFGLKNQNGVVEGYNLTTSSIEGTVTMNNLSSLDMMTSARQTGGSVQLNTVLTNVTLFGVTNYTYWTQNVLSYNDNFHQLTFNLNIWNFSSPTFSFPKNGIASGNGRVIDNEVYITHGPTFIVVMPVTVHLYTNASLINGDSAVFFNYTLTDAGKTVSGTFDEVLFNSTGGMHVGYTAPRPYYLISGTGLTPTKLLLFDAELMIGGPGGGSTTTIYTINATMTLKYYNATSASFYTVPSAFNFGTDTGETSAGTNVWWQGNTAFLNEGPSLLYGMWNVSNTVPHVFRGKITPSNAFMFVSGGSSFNSSADAWSPLSLSGNYNFHVPYSSVAGQILLSYYRAMSFTISTGMNFSLQKDWQAGIYTPLYAFDNSQVAYVAGSGDGSASSPYVLGYGHAMIHNPLVAPQPPAPPVISSVPGALPSPRGPAVVSLNPLFIELNDYLFPVFTGVFFWNVTVHVDMNSMPLFKVTYGPQLEKNLSLPSVYNYLNYEFYKVSNTSLWKTEVSGYFTDSFFPYSIILLDSSHMLIGGNEMYASGVNSFVGQREGGSIAILGGNSNTVWGNIFETNTFTDVGFGILIWSSGNLVYNNMFLRPVNFTALSPKDFSNVWNISKQPAYAVHYINGYALTGSIIHGTYQGGNFWWNYNGTIPYNDYGLIGSGGDYVPLIPLAAPQPPAPPVISSVPGALPSPSGHAVFGI